MGTVDFRGAGLAGGSIFNPDPVGLPFLAYGDSIGGQRNHWFRQLAPGELVRSGNTLTANFAHNFTQGELMRIATREPSGAYRASLQRPTILSPSSIRFTADLPGADGTNPAGTDNVCHIQNLSRYCAVGSWALSMAMMPSLAGRFRLEDSLANGGDNFTGLQVQLPFLRARAAALAQRGGIMLGNFGFVSNQWNDATGSPTIDIARELLRTGVRIVNVEVHATQASGTNSEQRRGIVNIRKWCERLQDEFPNFRFVDVPLVTQNLINADGQSIAGLQVADGVHYNQPGRLRVGHLIGSVVSDWIKTPPRRMRGGRADGILSGTALLSENIATALWNVTGSADTTLLAASTLVSGGASASGNTDPHIRLIGPAGVSFACFTEVTPDGQRRIAGFDVSFSAGSQVAEIAIVGPAAALYRNRVSPGHELEMGLDFWIGGIPGQSAPVGLQYADVVSDGGTGTNAMGGMDSTSPEFQSFLSTSRITESFGGAFWWPQPVVIPTGLTDFRPHVVKLGSHAAGSVRVVLNDHLARRIV